ncbi:MAG: TetR/AcrR family transcriptional regulator [Pseudomonadota bacterium]
MTAADPAPPPTRKRQRRKDARPGEIIQAGLEEFAEMGFAGARLDDVARRAGVAKGTIYRYFENKEALFEAAISSKVRTKQIEIEELVDNFEGSTETLVHMVLTKFYQEMVVSDARILMRIIIAEGHRFPELKKNYYNNVIRNGTRIIGKIVERGIARGEFRQGPIADLPRLIAAPTIMAAIWSLTFDDLEPLDMDKHYAAHVDLLLHGLRKK